MKKTVTKKVTATFNKKNCSHKCHFFSDLDFDGDPYILCGLYKKSLDFDFNSIGLIGTVYRCKNCIEEFE